MSTRAKSQRKTAPKTATQTEERIEGKEQRNMSDTLKRYRANYVKGRHTNDKLAEMLVVVTPEEMPALAEGLLNLESGELETKYAKLNRGQIRMNCGNRIRAAIKRGDITVAQVKTAIGNR